MELKIQNITSTFSLKLPLELNALARQLWNVEYNPRRFNALILRTREPRITALVFHTGKLVVIGAKSEEASREGARKVSKLIKRALKKKPSFCNDDFHMQNIVASSQTNYRICLEALFEGKPGFVYYEPENFCPAAKMYYKKGGKLIALIFRTGKLIYTGTTDFREIEDFHSYLQRLLLRFKE